MLKPLFTLDRRKVFLSRLFFFLLVVAPVSTEVISTGLAVGSALSASVFFAGYEFFKCKWYECCNSLWVPANTTVLKMELAKRLYGQPLVMRSVVRSVNAHLENKSPTKALVLSFHGWTGGGKNYVSSILAESLYKRGMSSAFVHFFSATLHFPHASLVDSYKDNLQRWIKGNVTLCAQSLFVFDEIDKMPAGVLDALKPFIDYLPHLQGVDYRRSIFIFLSNTGGKDIARLTLKYYDEGKQREQFGDAEVKEIEEATTRAAYNDEGGFHLSRLISSHLITDFIPFLPLEREHVAKCVRDQFSVRGWPPTPEDVERVVESLQYAKIYSASGCKRVQQKVDMLIEEERERREHIWEDGDDLAD